MTCTIEGNRHQTTNKLKEKKNYLPQTQEDIVIKFWFMSNFHVTWRSYEQFPCDIAFLREYLKVMMPAVKILSIFEGENVQKWGDLFHTIIICIITLKNKKKKYNKYNNASIIDRKFYQCINKKTFSSLELLVNFLMLIINEYKKLSTYTISRYGFALSFNNNYAIIYRYTY